MSLRKLTAAVSAVALAALVAATATPVVAAGRPGTGVQNVIPITEILSYGQKVTAVAVEYSADVNPRTLDLDTFTVSDSLYNFRFDPIGDLTDPTKRADRTVTAVYTNDAPTLEEDQESDRGRYVIIELD